MKNIHLCLYMISTALIGGCTYSSKTPGYSGNDITGAAEITRDKQTKAASLHVQHDGAWKLYAGPSVDLIDFSKPLLEGEHAGHYAIPVTDSVRSYFQLTTDGGTSLLAERHLPMTGGYNFRDLGGYKTQDGNYVKWGKVFRSDDLHKLTEADIAYLDAIPIRSIVDFRSAQEIENAPDCYPETAKDYALSISPGNLSDVAGVLEMSAQTADSSMRAVNRMLVTDPAAVARYRDYFVLLQNESTIPLMFHCTAGKDRTGMAAALFLYALGVDRETILEDYLASNRYLGDKYAALLNQYPALGPLLTVRREYLESGLDEIESEYGSIDEYLTETLNVDLKKMRDMYLDRPL